MPLLFRRVRGDSAFANIVLFSLMGIYMALRLLLRAALGKKRRDRILVAYQLDFATFMYKVLKFMRLHNIILMRLESPEGGYKYYCRINRDDLVFMTGNEDELMRHFTPNQGDIVIDVGAHIGTYTIMSARRVGQHGKVIAIEADPANFSILQRNIRLNRLTNVVAINVAAFSSRTRLKLYLPEEQSGRTIFNTVVSSRANEEDSFVQVEADTLDELLNSRGITTIDWLKIDVEGGEYEVLKGALNILSKNDDLSLMVEIHGSEMFKPVTELLSAHDYRTIFEKINERHDWGHIIARKSCL